MSNLAVSSVELVSALRTVPLNGSPSSNDFNQFQRDALSDLASLASFVNENLIPLMSSLPSVAANGLDGTGIWADQGAASTDTFFRDPQGNLYTVADVLSQINAALNTLVQANNDLSAQILAVQTRLATTQQNDLRVTVQNLQDTITSLTSQINFLTPIVSNQSNILAKRRTASVAFTSNFAQNLVVTIPMTPAFPDNNYAAVYSLEILSGSGASIVSFTKESAGAGILVTVACGSPNVSGNVNVIAQYLA